MAIPSPIKTEEAQVLILALGRYRVLQGSAVARRDGGAQQKHRPPVSWLFRGRVHGQRESFQFLLFRDIFNRFFSRSAFQSD